MTTLALCLCLCLLSPVPIADRGDLMQAGPSMEDVGEWIDRARWKNGKGTTMSDRKTTIARAICAERCAEYGEPPCWQVVDDGSLSPDCSDAHQCSCEQLAVAVEAELARPALIAREGGER